MAHWAKGEIHASLGADAAAKSAKGRGRTARRRPPQAADPSQPDKSDAFAVRRLAAAKWSRIADGLGWLNADLPSYDLAVFAWAVDPDKFRIEAAAQLRKPAQVH